MQKIIESIVIDGVNSKLYMTNVFCVAEYMYTVLGP